MEEKLPKISVVMATYNAENTIKISVDSILSQNFTDFEFIIVDDASTDNTFQILQEYAKKDSRIRLFRNEVNKERCFSRNFGIQASRAPYIAMLDNDDIALPHRLEKQFIFMEANPHIGLCGGGAKYINWFDFFPPPENESIRMNTLFECPLVHSTVFARKVAVENSLGNNEWYDSEFVLAEDYNFLCKLVLSRRITLYNLQEMFCHCVKDKWISTRESSVQYKARQRDTAWKVQEYFLSQMGFSQGNLKSFEHKALGGECTAISTQDFHSVLNWANALLQANNKASLYAPVEFQSFILQKWNNFAVQTALKCLEKLETQPS